MCLNFISQNGVAVNQELRAKNLSVPCFYRVQVRSARHTTGQSIGEEVLRQARRLYSGKPADGEDGRLKSQNNHLIGVWMPVSFIAQRGGGGEEVK